LTEEIAMANPAIHRPRAEASPKAPLRGIVRTAILLLGVVLASLLAVDLPVSENTADYVPAAGEWIQLGVRPSGSDAVPPT
jgi:hypothetical protein